MKLLLQDRRGLGCLGSTLNPGPLHSYPSPPAKKQKTRGSVEGPGQRLTTAGLQGGNGNCDGSGTVSKRTLREGRSLSQKWETSNPFPPRTSMKPGPSRGHSLWPARQEPASATARATEAMVGRSRIRPKGPSAFIGVAW